VIKRTEQASQEANIEGTKTNNETKHMQANPKSSKQTSKQANKQIRREQATKQASKQARGEASNKQQATMEEEGGSTTDILSRIRASVKATMGSIPLQPGRRPPHLMHNMRVLKQANENTSKQTSKQQLTTKRACYMCTRMHRIKIHKYADWCNRELAWRCLKKDACSRRSPRVFLSTSVL